jgi:hypothetical protein
MISEVFGPIIALTSFALYLLIISMALGRFFCFSFFILLASKAFFFLSSSSLLFISICCKAIFDLKGSTLGFSSGALVS